MKNILQQLEALVISLNKKNEFLKARVRLTILYILYITCILAILSFAIYWFFLNNLDLENIFPGDFIHGVENHLAHEGYSKDQFIHELKEQLQNIIFIVDIVIIFISSFFAYFLAKKTLHPIEAILQKHKQFSSDVAHELRTPLSVIKAGIEYTLIKERSVDEYIKLLKEQDEEINYLIDISNDLLDSINLPHKGILKKETNVSFLCEQQYFLMEGYFKKKNILFTKDIKSDIWANIDASKVKRVLYNILKNAADYSGQNGKVVFTLKKDEKDFSIIISDTGIGIAKDDIQNIFQQFFKVDTSRESRGSGLGLYMSQEIITAHNGSIFCESTIHEGSRFTIKIPFK